MDIEDSVTEVSEISWGSRLMESIKGVIFGAVLFGLSFIVLFWNEGRAVKTAKSLEEGKGSVVSMSSDKVNPRNQNKLVHMTGQATTQEILKDETFAIAENAIRMHRSVEMYQWYEKKETRTERKLGGKKVRKTIYKYDRKWSSDLIQSSQFRKTSGHENPESMPYSKQNWQAQEVKLGAFALSDSLIRRISAFQPLVANDKNIPAQWKDKARISNNQIYLGKDPGSPQIGDVRIGFSVVRPCTVSIVAQQDGNSFRPYMTTVGRELEMLELGNKSSEAMFQHAIDSNIMLTWILRLVGFVMMLFGIMAMFGPFVTFADVIPILGDILGAGIFLFSLVIALALSLVTIAIAWLFYRPLLALILIAVAIGIFFGIKQMRKKPEVAPQP